MCERPIAVERLSPNKLLKPWPQSGHDWLGVLQNTRQRCRRCPSLSLSLWPRVLPSGSQGCLEGRCQSQGLGSTHQRINTQHNSARTLIPQSSKTGQRMCCARSLSLSVSLSLARSISRSLDLYRYLSLFRVCALSFLLSFSSSLSLSRTRTISFSLILNLWETGQRMYTRASYLPPNPPPPTPPSLSLSLMRNSSETG